MRLGLVFLVRLVGFRYRCWKSWRFSVDVLLVLFFIFFVLINSSLHYLFNLNIW
jgi:hypothetical protein